MKWPEKLNPITRYGPCFGITIWKWGLRKVEIWYAPAKYEVPEHVHSGCSSEFTILWSRNRRIYRKTHIRPKSSNWWEKPVKLAENDVQIFAEHGYRILKGPGDEYIATTPKVWGLWLSVRAGVPHKFYTGDSPMIFIAVEKWKDKSEMSLASNFRVTE